MGHTQGIGSLVAKAAEGMQNANFFFFFLLVGAVQTGIGPEAMKKTQLHEEEGLNCYFVISS